MILNTCNGSALEAEVQDGLELRNSFKGSLDNVRLSKKKLKDKKSSKWKTKSFTKGKEISSNKLEYNKQLLWFCIVIWATCFCSIPFFGFYVNCFVVLGVKSRVSYIWDKHSDNLIRVVSSSLLSLNNIYVAQKLGWADVSVVRENCSCRGPGLIHSSTTSGDLCRSSSSRRFAGLFWCPWAPALTYMYAHTNNLK